MLSINNYCILGLCVQLFQILYRFILLCKFVSDNTEVYTCTQGNNSATNWLYSECLAQIFPFNHLDNTSFDLIVFESIYGIYTFNYCYLHDVHLNADSLYGTFGKFKQLLGYSITKFQL